jgi:hypothetical protein
LSHALREEQISKVCENSILREYFDLSERNNKGCKNVYNEELHIICCSPDIRVSRVRRMRWVWHVKSIA